MRITNDRENTLLKDTMMEDEIPFKLNAIRLYIQALNLVTISLHIKRYFTNVFVKYFAIYMDISVIYSSLHL